MYLKTFKIFLLFVILFSVSCSESANTAVQPEIENPKITDPEKYEPTNANSIDKDVKISPNSASASEYQSGTDIQKTIDGDKSTIYHSRWGDATEYPVELIYNFSDTKDLIDYFVLYPRSDATNGDILELSVYTKAQGESDYALFKEYVFTNGNSPKMIAFPEGFVNPASIKLSVTKGVNDFVSLAEIEFYKESATLEASLSVFSDKACTVLVPGTTREDIDNIDNEFIKAMALAIFNEVYEEFRIGNFKSYANPDIASIANKTGTYGIYDNATGIYVKWGTDMVVFMNDFEGEISLRVVNHNQGFGGVDYVLKPGVNRFQVNTEGLAYLIYQNEAQYEVKANFATGKINGYFDVAKHTNEDWQALIDNAEYTYFDVLGELSMLSFTTADFRQYNTNITELIGLYDNMVDLEQDFLGLYKYDRANKSRMYYRTNTHQDMFMYATSNRTEYHKSTMPGLINPNTLKTDPWGPAHEIGHINQTSPGLKWLGLTEVTTNIYSLYIQTTWGNAARIDEEVVAPYNNRYENALTEIVAANISHAEHGDVFCKLVPFWQLQLYFSDVLGKKDFYKDVHEIIRTTEDADTNGESQIEFAKICSDAAETDLTAFFIDWGFLKVVDKELNDYGAGTITVTQTMVDDAIADIKSKGYPEPAMKLQFIHEQSLNIYKSKGALSIGNASVVNNEITITGTNNAVVYQQERDGNIIYISVRDKFTVTSFNASDKIFAVGYDGERQEISVQ
ncbi:M60 family metallopeptidase [Polaribacter atrinae]|uniref:M60 family metallopeptidase n=1 Tax=Polaribacter atrinae TaxID=1333662 RepID=UPI0024922EDA|nr:M60 family metallopeptidase [Polaribacter atrinae]